MYQYSPLQICFMGLLSPGRNFTFFQKNCAVPSSGDSPWHSGQSPSVFHLFVAYFFRIVTDTGATETGPDRYAGGAGSSARRGVPARTAPRSDSHCPGLLKQCFHIASGELVDNGFLGMPAGHIFRIFQSRSRHAGRRLRADGFIELLQVVLKVDVTDFFCRRKHHHPPDKVLQLSYVARPVACGKQFQCFR